MLVVRTHLPGGLFGALLVLCSTSALHAAPTPAPAPTPVKPAAPPTKESVKDKCIADADEGQTLRDGGKLRDARSRFVGCASSTCPGVVARECSTWLADVEARIPTVVVSAVDGSGNDLVDVKVSLDGRPFLDRLNGAQTAIDPGPHRFRFEYAGAAPVEETFVISERQKGRVVQAKLGPASTAAPVGASGHEAGDAAITSPGSGSASAGPRSSPPIAAYIVGGVGVLALGSFAFFGLKGHSDYSSLKDSCDPNCAKSDTDSVKTKFLVADVSLGVGVVAIGVATYLFLTHPKGERSAKGASFANHAVVSPVRGGGWLAGYETKF